jgi:hypothetical protein
MKKTLAVVYLAFGKRFLELKDALIHEELCLKKEINRLIIENNDINGKRLKHKKLQLEKNRKHQVNLEYKEAHADDIPF